MEIDFLKLEPSQCYATMIRAITPRPIAWISTISPSGITNLAPFSYFSGVGSAPPCLMFSVADKPDGSPKDTLRNVESTGQFVVNVVPFSMRQAMAHSAIGFDYEDSEFQRTGLTESPSRTVAPPRVSESPVNFECRVNQIVRIGSATAVFGIIQWLHVDERVLDDLGKIDPELLDTIGRLGGRSYTRTHEHFEIS